MQAFVWDKRFETGITHVDAQHRDLVDIVNQLGHLLEAGDDLAGQALQDLFHRLAQYAHRHFADEEQLMSEAGIDLRHLQEHSQRHRQFVDQVVSLWNGRNLIAHPAETLHGFLASWLTVHILGEDQCMARQIAAIHQGTAAPEAYLKEIDAAMADTGTSVLLEAMDRLYGLLSEQNRNLAQANQLLEARIAERTRELQEANQQLANEQQELTQLLGKIEEAQRQLVQSEKMAAIGQLAAGVAHEINNPVGFVNSNLGTLKNYVDQLLSLLDAHEAVASGGDPAQLVRAREQADIDFVRADLPALIAESQEGLDRVTHIVQDLKDFSHVDEIASQDADLNAGLTSTLNVVRNELKYKADVSLDLGEIPRVPCIPAQINQVFMNILVNAAQAIEGHGRINIRSWQERNQVCIEIADSGRGMSADIQKRIFEPFYTTKPVGKGTGLGLSLSYDIIKKHGGTLDVSSEPGCGSTFCIRLPLPTPAEVN